MALTIVFVTATATLFPFSIQRGSGRQRQRGHHHRAGRAAGSVLIPTIGGLLSAIGVPDEPHARRQRDRHQRPRGGSRDVDVLLLDKTGTITLGNRRASSSRRRA